MQARDLHSFEGAGGICGICGKQHGSTTTKFDHQAVMSLGVTRRLKQKNTPRNLLVAAQRLEGRRVDVEFGISRTKPRCEASIRIAQRLEWLGIPCMFKLAGMADRLGVQAMLVSADMIRMIVRVDHMSNVTWPLVQKGELCRKRLVSGLLAQARDEFLHLAKIEAAIE